MIIIGRFQKHWRRTSENDAAGTGKNSRYWWVGLGNREVTADALGPQVIDNLLITRHVVKNYGKAAYNCTG